MYTRAVKLRRIFLGVAGLALVAGGVAYWATRRAPLVTLEGQGRPPLLIQNVRVIDVITGSAAPGRDVLIKDGLISAVGPHDPKGEPPEGGRVIPGAGLSLIPGLIDVHCHVGASPQMPWQVGLPDPELNLERLLFSGVTRVFDPGAAAPDIFELREAVASGALLGPTIHTAGPIFTAVGGHPEPMFRELLPGLLADYLLPSAIRQVARPEDAEPLVRALMPMRPDFIKVVVDRIPENTPRLTAALARAVVDAARAHKLRAVAHIGSAQDALDAGNAGVSAWVHGVYKERLTEEALDKLAAFKIPMAPTMIVFESYARAGEPGFEVTELERQVTEPALLKARAARPKDFSMSKGSAQFVKMLRAQRDNGRENVGRLAARGVTILAGSDSQSGVIHGPALHRELKLLVISGLSPLEALRATTLYAARFLEDKADPSYGVIAPGKRADLVLVRGDPLKRIEAISEIERVILGGRTLARHPLQ